MKIILIFIIFSVLSLSGCGGPGTNATANNVNNGTISNTNGMSFKKSLPQGFNEPADDVGRRLLKEYGAVFVAGGGTVAPKTVVFKDEKEVAAFQAGVQISKEHIGDFDLELQAPAMNALKNARGEAEAQGLTITPRSGDSARRNYEDTVGLWASRVEPALVHWVGQSKLDQAEADRIRSLTPYEQVPEVFKLESQGCILRKTFPNRSSTRLRRPALRSIFRCSRWMLPSFRTRKCGKYSRKTGGIRPSFPICRILRILGSRKTSCRGGD